MSFLKKARSPMRKFGKVAVTGSVMLGAMAILPAEVLAQSGDPFAKATKAAESVQASLSELALVVGGIGMVACLMLGFFGKLNWKWLATGIGVSFALVVIPTAISWLAQLGRS